MKKCVLIDDDKVFCKIIDHYITKTPGLVQDGIYHSPIEAMSKVNFDQVDFLFLDVEMPEMTGFEFLSMIDRQKVQVILMSRKESYGIEAFNHYVVDYLQKPISFELFARAIKRARSREEQMHQPTISEDAHLFVKVDRIWEKIGHEDILSAKADNNYVNIRTPNGLIKCALKIGQLMEKLDSQQFMQVHRSHLVNLSHVDRVDGEIVEVKGKSIPVSRAMVKDLYSRLQIPHK